MATLGKKKDPNEDFTADAGQVLSLVLQCFEGGRLKRRRVEKEEGCGQEDEGPEGVQQEEVDGEDDEKAEKLASGAALLRINRLDGVGRCPSQEPSFQLPQFVPFTSLQTVCEHEREREIRVYIYGAALTSPPPLPPPMVEGLGLRFRVLGFRV